MHERCMQLLLFMGVVCASMLPIKRAAWEDKRLPKHLNFSPAVLAIKMAKTALSYKVTAALSYKVT